MKVEKLMYIEALLLTRGKVRRAYLMERFRISPKSATLLLEAYIQQCPDQMELIYGPKPHYAASTSLKPCLFDNESSAKRFMKISTQMDAILSSVDI